MNERTDRAQEGAGNESSRRERDPESVTTASATPESVTTATAETAASAAVPAAIPVMDESVVPMLPDGRFTGIGVRGLHFPRRWTTPGVHPYDEIEWETRTASIGNEKGVDRLRAEGRRGSRLLEPARHQRRRQQVLPRPPGHARARDLRPPADRPRRQHHRRLGRDAALLRHGRGPARLSGRADPPARPPEDELQLAGLVQRRRRSAPAVLGLLHQLGPGLDELDHGPGQDRGDALQVRLGRRLATSRPIRSSKEKMSGGGTASGPVSFMRGYDAFAGVIKSGGKTRRAAKMVILDVDHPDIVEFINCKVEEEKKAWALIEAGYDASFTGEAYGSVFFQNANHSVRVTDDFMRAVVADGEWTTRAVVGRRADGHATRRATSSARWPRRPGSAATRASSTTPRSTTGTLSRTRTASTPPTRAREYMFLDDSGCNLASLNLMKFVRRRRRVRRRGLPLRRRLTITAQEILVDNASYPTPAIDEQQPPLPPARPRLRQPRRAADEPRPRLRLATRAGPTPRAITALMTGEAYRQSAVIARDHGGPFAEYERTGRRSCASSRSTATPPTASRTSSASRRTCTAPRATSGTRRSSSARQRLPQRAGHPAAPTGTIAFMMDCDTTGIEPDIALVKYKKLVGGGLLKIVNQTVPGALRKLGYTPDAGRGDRRLRRRARDDRGRAGLKPEHLSVFDCAFKPMQRHALDPLHGPPADDGGGPAVPLRRDQQDRQHARGGHAPRRSSRSTSRAGGWASRRSRSTATAPSAASRSSTGKKKDDEAGRGGGAELAALGPGRAASRTGAACRTSAPRSPTSSTSRATRATSPSASTRTASRARSSSRWPRKAPPSPA